MSSQALTVPAVSLATQSESIIGKPLKRKEDSRILQGHSRYVDDIKMKDMLHGAMLRSPYAHASIKSIDLKWSLKMPGVRFIFTAEDLPARASWLPVEELADGTTIPRRVLAKDEVCYVGEPIAFVVADSLYAAEDALDEIRIDYERLETVTDPEQALADQSPKSHLGISSNLVQVETVSTGDVEAAFKNAPIVVRMKLENQRLAPSPLEPRGCIASFDEGTEVMNLWISTQGPFQVRENVSELLNFPENKVKVAAPDVGGGFGAKLSLYSEEILVCLAAMKTMRPVKWIETRSENFSSMTHGRGQIQRVELAATEEGRILGLKVNIIGDAGAYLTDGSSDASFSLKMVPGQYVVPAYKGEARIVLTNKVPHDAYRGASRPEATYLIERTMDQLARQIGVDPAEVRLRNFIEKENFPYISAGDLKYDTGDYAMNLQKALDLADYERWREKQKHMRDSNRLLGIGLASYAEVCSFGPEYPQTAAIYVSEKGRVTVISGTSPHGQGHETPFSQIVAEKLGISVDEIAVIFGDTTLLPWATMTAGSRSAALGGSAVLMCAEKIKKKMAEIASAALGVPEEDLVFSEGRIFSKWQPSDPRNGISFDKIASLAYDPDKLPEGMEPVLYAFSCFVPPSNTFPFGTHVAVVEIDKETGVVKVLTYISVDDCGKVLNSMIVEGQIQGGIAQGLGQALLEEVEYDGEGHLLTSSFLDYQIPMAEDIPFMRNFRTETPTFANKLGIKGVGEAGTIAAPPTLVNAVRDALSQIGSMVEKMPLSPEYVRNLIVQNLSAKD